MMTGSLHEREFSRKTFVKGSAAVAVGLGLGGAGLPGTAGAEAYTSIVAPDQSQIDSWLSINPDNTVSMYSSKLEHGQGTWTGHRQIVAEELDVPVDSVTMPLWDSGSAHPMPNGGPTVGSSGTANGGPPLRQAAAAARQALLAKASATLGVPAASLAVSNGVVSGGGKSVTYAQLQGGQPFNTKITGLEPIKDPSTYTVVGTRVPRFDIPPKVIGEYTYIANVRIPGMLHGRPVRPRGQANVFGQANGGSASFTLIGVDPTSIAHLSNVQIVQRGNFVGVVSPYEYDAIEAAAVLKVNWVAADTLPGIGNQYGALRASPTRDAQVLNYGNVDSAFQSAAKVLTATYQWPFQMHSPIGPCCAIADVGISTATMYMSGQDTWGYLPGISLATGIPQTSIRLVHFEGASTNNREPHTHPAVDAAIMAQAVGKPVRVQFMRWDGQGYEAYGQNNLADLKAGLDANGNLVAYDYVSWLAGNTTNVSDGTNAPGNVQLGNPVPPDATTGSSVRGAPTYNAPTTNNSPSGGARIETFSTGDQYFPNIPNRRVTGKTVTNTFRTCPLRGPDCIQACWASESFIDELAHAANVDAYQFRFKMTTHPGWLGVLNAVAKASNWQPRVSASNLSSDTVVTGRGIAIGGENHADSDAYAGAVAEVSVNKETGEITVNHVYGAQDSGFVINPASIENQMSGMITQATSRTLLEEVNFNRQRVTSLDWVTYPMLRFKAHPSVTTIVIGHTDEVVPASASPAATPGPRYRGGGESLTVVVPAAIGNAFFDATGVRMRQVPLTAAKVRAALKAARVA